MSDYTVLSPFTAGSPLREMRAGETVRGEDLAGWSVSAEEIRALVSRGKLVVKSVSAPEAVQLTDTEKAIHDHPGDAAAQLSELHDLETALPAPEPHHDEQP